MMAVREYRSGEQGVVAIIFALVIIPIIMATGLAVDFGRAYMVRSALQTTIDSAVIAAAAQPSTSQAVLENVITSYVTANAPAKGVTVNTPTVSYDAAKEMVTVSVTAEIATTFLKIAGVTKMNLAVTADARRPTPPPLEIALVLDTTVSMNEVVGTQTKLKSLQSATKSMINAVMTNENVKIGIVPFGMAVRYPPNLGRDPVTKTPLKTWLWFDNSLEVLIPTHCWWAVQGECNWVWNMVDGVLTYQYSCANSGRTCDYTTSRMLKWEGCIGSRPANATFGDMRASNANLANNNTVRDYPAIVPGEITPCSREMLPLTNVKATVTNVIDTLFVHGDTFIPQGLLWGWNMLTPEEPLTEARSKTDMQALGGQKVLVLMTDGVNSLSPWRKNPTRVVDSGHATTSLTEYKTEAPVGKYTDDLTTTLCTNIKDDGITVYTVMFNVSDAGLKALLSACASDPTKAYDAADTAQLTNAFKEIGQQLMKLRIVK